MKVTLFREIECGDYLRISVFVIFMMALSLSCPVFAAHARPDVTLEDQDAELDALAQSMALRASGQEELINNLNEMKEVEGRDNAMIHYVLSQTIPTREIGKKEKDLIERTLVAGWSSESVSLLPLLDSYKPVFEEIRKGTALDYAHGTEPYKGSETPVPNYFHFQIAAKLFCIQAMQQEVSGDQRAALENCLVVLTLGRDLGSQPAPIIGYLVGSYIEDCGMKILDKLTASGKLDKSGLEKALDHLVHIQRTQSRMADAFKWEKEAMKVEMKKLVENPDYARKMWESADSVKPEGVTLEDIFAQKERIDAETQHTFDLMIEYLSTPAHVRNAEKFDLNIKEYLKGVHPVVSFAAFATGNYGNREGVYLTRINGSILLAALELYRDEHTNFPAELSALAPKYIDEMPVDPFTGQNFHYEIQNEGKTFRLYAVGPDKKDDKGHSVFDIKNGVKSDGDILLP